VQGTAIAILPQPKDGFNPIEFDGFASKTVAANAMNTGATGRFCINSRGSAGADTPVTHTVIPAQAGIQRVKRGLR